MSQVRVLLREPITSKTGHLPFTGVGCPVFCLQWPQQAPHDFPGHKPSTVNPDFIPDIVISFLLFFSLFTINPTLALGSKGAWDLYVVPNKYTINQGERLELVFGLTGYGNIDQSKLKVTVYSEADTLIQYGDYPARYDTFAIAPTIKSPPDRFSKPEEITKGSIILVSDSNSGFDKLFLTPKSSGNKRLTLNATYFIPDDGWHSAKYEYDYHVNTWAEEHQTGITIFGIIIGVLSISFLPSIGMKILGLDKNTPHKSDHSKKSK